MANVNLLSLLPILLRAIANEKEIAKLADDAIPLVNTMRAQAPSLFDRANKLMVAIAPEYFTDIPQPSAPTLNVKWVQASLNKLMNEKLDVDGVYGPLTHAAVARYQVARGLEVDGWVGPLTIAKLYTEVHP